MIIKTKNFTLRPYRKGDEKSLIEHINDKNVHRYTMRIPYPYKSRFALDWIRYNIRSDKSIKKKEVSFAIDIGGKVVGGLGLMSIDGHKAEIGYWLGRKYWNKGIMTEAVKLTTNYGFSQLKLKRIYAGIFCRNVASLKVLEKNRYKLEGRMIKYYRKNGRCIDALLYAKTK